MSQQERLKIVNQYIGFGNPYSKVWFFGSEEKGKWTLDDKLIEQCKNISFEVDTIEESPNKTYQGYIKMLKKLFPTNLKGEYFISNLWPIGKENTNQDFSPDQKNYFGLDNLNFHESLNHIKDERFFSLEMFFKLFDWKSKYIFFCVGNENTPYLNEFIKRLTFNKKLNFNNKECYDVSIINEFKNIFQPYHASRIDKNFNVAMDYIKIKCLNYDNL